MQQWNLLTLQYNRVKTHNLIITTVGAAATELPHHAF